MNSYVGIDVAFRKSKRLPICVASWKGGRLIPLALRSLAGVYPPHGRGNRVALEPAALRTFALEVLAYLRSVESETGMQIQRVAIDAPSRLRREHLSRRAAETAMDRCGVRCIGTPSALEFRDLVERGKEHLARGGTEARLPGANQLWMLVGFALFDVLGHEYPCIEVFPQATAVALGAAGIHKGKSEGLRAQLRAVSQYTGWPDPVDPRSLMDIGFGSRDDKLDAYLSAWVASLSPEERLACGELPDDVIWVPRFLSDDAGIEAEHA